MDDPISRIEAALEEGPMTHPFSFYPIHGSDIRALLDRLKSAELQAQHWQAEHATKDTEAEHFRNRLKAAEEENERLRDALERLARLGNGRLYGNSEGNMIARAALENTNAR